MGMGWRVYLKRGRLRLMSFYRVDCFVPILISHSPTSSAFGIPFRLGFLSSFGLFPVADVVGLSSFLARDALLRGASHVAARGVRWLGGSCDFGQPSRASRCDAAVRLAQ